MAHATWNSSVKARKISAWGPGEAGSRGLHGFDVGARPPEQCLGAGFAAPSRAPVPNWLQSAPTKSFRSQTWVQPPLPDTCPPLLVITRCTPARVCCRGARRALPCTEQTPTPGRGGQPASPAKALLPSQVCNPGTGRAWGCLAVPRAPRMPLRALPDTPRLHRPFCPLVG